MGGGAKMKYGLLLAQASVCWCPSRKEAGRGPGFLVRITALGVRHPWDQNPVLSLPGQVTLGRNFLLPNPSFICEMGVIAVSWDHREDEEMPKVNKILGP